MQCQNTRVIGEILNRDTFHNVGVKMFPHVINHAGVGHTQNFGLTDNTENHVINDEALLVKEVRVSTPSRRNRTGFLSTDTIHPFTHILSGKSEKTHVRNIEQTGIFTGVEVFFHHRCIPNRQFKSVEIDNVASSFDMCIVECGANQLAF